MKLGDPPTFIQIILVVLFCAPKDYVWNRSFNKCNEFVKPRMDSLFRYFNIIHLAPTRLYLILWDNFINMELLSGYLYVYILISCKLYKNRGFTRLSITKKHYWRTEFIFRRLYHHQEIQSTIRNSCVISIFIIIMYHLELTPKS
jgi:hypothetical protein